MDLEIRHCWTAVPEDRQLFFLRLHGMKKFSTGCLFSAFLAVFVCATSALAQPSRPGLGATLHESGTIFRVWAPFASSADVAGEFNEWEQTPMTRDATDGTWSVDIPAAAVGQRYKYVFNGDLWKRDPRARQVTHSNGDSVIYDPDAFDWGSESFSIPARNDLVLYQLHVGTFAGGDPPSTFDDAIAHLDHLRDLGVTAIQLMPVNEFPGGRSWGYNPSDLFAIETDYGGPDAFKRFVRAAHERGLAVFVDVVHNHYGPTDLDLWRFDGWSRTRLRRHLFLQRQPRQHPVGHHPPRLRPPRSPRLHPRPDLHVRRRIPRRRLPLGFRLQHHPHRPGPQRRRACDLLRGHQRGTRGTPPPRLPHRRGPCLR